MQCVKRFYDEQMKERGPPLANESSYMVSRSASFWKIHGNPNATDAERNACVCGLFIVRPLTMRDSKEKIYHMCGSNKTFSPCDGHSFAYHLRTNNNIVHVSDFEYNALVNSPELVKHGKAFAEEFAHCICMSPYTDKTKIAYDTQKFIEREASFYERCRPSVVVTYDNVDELINAIERSFGTATH